MIEILDLAGRLAVAGAFVLAAVLKLADLPGVRATLYLSRVTRPWVPQLTWLLPGVEFVLAAGLVTTRAGWSAAVLSAALLVAFTLFLVLDRSAGEGCTCFGRRSRSSRSGGIVRDVLLLAVLVPALARGPAADRPGVPEGSEVAFGLVYGLAVVAGARWAIHRDRGHRARPRSPGRRRVGVPPQPLREVRRQAVPFDLPTLDGGRLRLADLLPAGTVLLFVETGCELCELVLPQAAGRPDVVVVAAGPAADVAALASRYRLAPGRVALDEDGAVADTYRLPATPGACRLTPEGVLVGADGKPAERLSIGVEAIRELLASG